MLRFTKSVILGIFLLWVLPLGAFIDPSKENLACGGQRAICLCRHKLIISPGQGKAVIKVVPNTAKEDTSSASNHDFILVRSNSLPQREGSVWQNQSDLPCTLPFVRTIEYVPKA